MGKQGVTNKAMSKQCSKRECEWEDISGEQGRCYELEDGPRAYRGSVFSARTRLQLMCCATRRLLSSNFGRETDKGSEVRMVSSRDNQCRFQTEEHT